MAPSHQVARGIDYQRPRNMPLKRSIIICPDYKYKRESMLSQCYGVLLFSTEAVEFLVPYLLYKERRLIYA